MPPVGPAFEDFEPFEDSRSGHALRQLDRGDRLPDTRQNRVLGRDALSQFEWDSILERGQVDAVLNESYPTRPMADGRRLRHS